MKYLFDHLSQIRNFIAARPVALFLDYDGTLAPIAPTPDEALLPSAAKNILLKTIKTPGIRTAIVSGRALEDVRRLIGIKDLIYVGNHGFEISGAGLEFESLVSPAYKQLLVGIKSEIDNTLAGFSGVLMEDKCVTLSIHYRLTSVARHAELVRLIEKMFKPYVDRKEIRVTSGKMVFEVRPPIVWDKGMAVLWVLKRLQFISESLSIFPICIGDDVTDEDSFAAVKDIGMSVCVGKRENSLASYFVESPEEVVRFLEHIQKVKEHDQ